MPHLLVDGQYIVKVVCRVVHSQNGPTFPCSNMVTNSCEWIWHLVDVVEGGGVDKEEEGLAEVITSAI